MRADRGPQPGNADPRRARVGFVLVAVGCSALVGWLAWRVSALGPHPVEVVCLGAELVGVASAVVIALGLARARGAREVWADGRADCHRFAVGVADIVGRTRVDDLYRAVRSRDRSAPLLAPRNLPDATISAVVLEGPRRLVMVLAVTLGLLLGVSPLPAPPPWAVASASVGYLCLSTAHVVLGRGRIRFGDRTRWSYGAIGEVVARADLPGIAPRRWMGAMAVAVGVSVAVALRGMSDRWTHGLAPMEYDHRVPALVFAVALVLGALYMISTSPRPDPADPATVARRLDESTVRPAVLAAAVLVGVVGLFAGVLPVDDGRDDRAPAVAPANTLATDRASDD